jgi:hypothetical protein
MDKAEQARILAIRAALVSTTATTGWRYVRQMADNVVARSTQEALDEEDPIKGESKRLKAKALQKGFQDLFNAIETTKAIDLRESDSAFGELEIGVEDTPL